MTKSESSIIDTTVPNAGRVYDYILGGYHNFEVDRLAAQQVMTALPFAAKFVRLQRWCLQDIAEELVRQRGFDVIIDFASGLPTSDNMHSVVSEGTTVIYSDFDPVVVEYAHDILRDTPNVYYFRADARKPEELLNRPEVLDILAGRRKVAVVYWGVAAFLADEDISHAARVIHQWTGPGSVWAMNAQGAGSDPDNPVIQRLAAIYEQMGSRFYLRSAQEYEALLRPWKPDARGFISLLDWHHFDSAELDEQTREAVGPTGAGYGVYLDK